MQRSPEENLQKRIFKSITGVFKEFLWHISMRAIFTARTPKEEEVLVGTIYTIEPYNILI